VYEAWRVPLLADEDASVAPADAEHNAKDLHFVQNNLM
jgi:hypothetical protein